MPAVMSTTLLHLLLLLLLLLLSGPGEIGSS